MWPQGLYGKYTGAFDFEDRAKFKYRYCFWPRCCSKTGRLLWGETALYGRLEIHGIAGDPPLVEERWYDSSEGLIMMLKKASE